MHTPGPWRLVDGKSEVIAGDCYHVAFVKAWFPEHAKQQEANARLIAAAPEMLAEINNVIDMLDPEMGRLAIVELRERLIQFRSKVTDADQTSAMGEDMASDEHPDMSGNPCDDPIICDQCGDPCDESNLYGCLVDEDKYFCSADCARDYGDGWEWGSDN